MTNTSSSTATLQYHAEERATVRIYKPHTIILAISQSNSNAMLETRRIQQLSSGGHHLDSLIRPLLQLQLQLQLDLLEAFLVIVIYITANQVQDASSPRRLNSNDMDMDMDIHQYSTSSEMENEFKTYTFRLLHHLTTKIHPIILKVGQ
jgi:hypothetical protein